MWLPSWLTDRWAQMTDIFPATQATLSEHWRELGMPLQPVQITVRLMLLHPSGDFWEKGWLMSADKCRELVRGSLYTGYWRQTAPSLQSWKGLPVKKGHGSVVDHVWLALMLWIALSAFTLFLDWLSCYPTSFCYGVPGPSEIYVWKGVLSRLSCSSTACDWTTGRKRSHSDSIQLTDK